MSHSARHCCSKAMEADLVQLKIEAEIYLTHHKPDEQVLIRTKIDALLAKKSIKPLKNNDRFTL